MLVLACVVVASWAQQAIADTVALRSPDGKIAATLLDDNGTLPYSVTFQGHPVIEQSALGLKKDATSLLKIAEVSRSSVDKQWESIWGNQKLNNDRYHEVQLKVSETSQQTIIFRAYNDGIAFRCKIPDTRKFSDKAYAHEATQIKFLSQQTRRERYQVKKITAKKETLFRLRLRQAAAIACGFALKSESNRMYCVALIDRRSMPTGSKVRPAKDCERLKNANG